MSFCEGDKMSSGSSNSTGGYWVSKYTYDPMPLEIAIFASVISGILGFIGSLTNAFVMFLISRIKADHELENMDIYILSLCLSDFLSSTVAQPQLIPRILKRTYITKTQSVLLHITIHVTLTSGCLSLFMVTIDKYLSIKFPFSYAIYATKKNVLLSTAIPWTIALGLAVFILLDGETESFVYPVLASVTFISTIFLQIMIFIIARAQKRSMQRQVEAVEHNDVDSGTRRRDNRFKANKTIVLMSAVYVSTWLPSIIYRLLYVAGKISFTFYIQWLHIFNIILQLHSCINPYIYVLRTKRIQTVFRRFYGTVEDIS